MRPKFTLFLIYVSAFLLHTFYINTAEAQVRKGGGGRKGSLYFSGGMNTVKYSPSTIHIDQPSLGNSYDLTKVNGDNKTENKALSPTQFNYRIGYYFGYFQKYGIELNYDPANYHITDGQSVQEKGTINDMTNVNKTIPYYAKNGYYYYMGGANLLLVNFIRRFTLYRPNSNRIGIDAIAKAGVGPAMPNVQSSFPAQPAAPKYQYGGWNAGVEGAVRVTFYRYVYLEFAAKYDYASLDNLNIYEGTAKQNLASFELIGSLGFTFPTRRYNPLFYKGRRIITILPLYTLKDHAGKSYGKTRKDKNNEETEKKSDGASDAITDVPEFKDISERKERLLREDSLLRVAKEDSIYKSLHPADTAIQKDTTVNKDTTTHDESKRSRRRRRKHEAEAAADSAANTNMPGSPAIQPVKTDTAMAIPPVNNNIEQTEKIGNTKGYYRAANKRKYGKHRQGSQ